MSKLAPTLEALGWNPSIAKQFEQFRTRNLEPARVGVEDKHHYVLFTGGAMHIGKVTGKLLHARR